MTCLFRNQFLYYLNRTSGTKFRASSNSTYQMLSCVHQTQSPVASLPVGPAALLGHLLLGYAPGSKPTASPSLSVAVIARRRRSPVAGVYARLLGTNPRANDQG
ncbi:hypothetical protein ACLOJK_029146 [Asimina triloba]